MTATNSHLWTTTRRGKIYGWTWITRISRCGTAWSLRLCSGYLHREIDCRKAGGYAWTHRADPRHTAYSTGFVMIHRSGRTSRKDKSEKGILVLFDLHSRIHTKAILEIKLTKQSPVYHIKATLSNLNKFAMKM